MSDDSGRPVGSVARALALLDALAEGPAGVNALARRIGVNPSSASRLLATLERGGLVEREPGGPYRLGLHLVALADRVLARLDVRDLARPQLRALVEATGETATLSVPDGEEAVTVDFVPGGVERREHGAARPAEHRPRHGGREGAARVHRPASRPRSTPTPSARSPTRRRSPPSSRPCARRAGPRPSASASPTSTRSPRPVAGPRRRARGDPRPAGPGRRASRPSAAARCCPSCSPPRRRSRARWAAEPARWAVRPDSGRRTARPRAAADNRRVTVPRRLRLLVLVPCLLLGPARRGGGRPRRTPPVRPRRPGHEARRRRAAWPYGYHSDAVADVPDATVVARGRPGGAGRRAGRGDRDGRRRARRRRGAATPPPALAPGTGTPDDVANAVHPHDHAAVQGRLRLRVRPGRAASTSWPTGSRRTCRCSRASWRASPAARRRSASTWARRAAPATSTSRSSACRAPIAAYAGPELHPARRRRPRHRRGSQTGPRDWIVYADAHAPGLGRRHGRVLLRRRGRGARRRRAMTPAGSCPSSGARRRCPPSPYADPTTMLHEMGHNLGAVQGGAPHTTGTVGVDGRRALHRRVGRHVLRRRRLGQRAELPLRRCGPARSRRRSTAAATTTSTRPRPPARGSRRTGTCTPRRCSARAPASSPVACGVETPAPPLPVNQTPAAPSGWARRAVRGRRSPARTRRSGSGASTAGAVRTGAQATVAGGGVHTLETRVGSAGGVWTSWRSELVRLDATAPTVRLECFRTVMPDFACTASGGGRRVRARRPRHLGRSRRLGRPSLSGQTVLISAPATVTATATDRVGLVGTAQREIALPATTTCRPSRPSPRRRRCCRRHAPCPSGSATAAAAPGAVRSSRSPPPARIARRGSRLGRVKAPAGAYRITACLRPAGPQAALPDPYRPAAARGQAARLAVSAALVRGPVQATVAIARKRGGRYARPLASARASVA